MLARMLPDCKVADESGSAAEKEDCLRTRFLQEHPETLQRFTSDLLPLLLQVYGSTVLDKVSFVSARQAAGLAC